ncbi:tyrosine-type recombinase/integrase [Paenibacillus sp. TAB 01]|uniref:tyrosine-type recombinase/integrase n=1 Tax=Paenibacillus sp. TAB 01 TaxID=3368988 RepID=UPI0037512D19
MWEEYSINLTGKNKISLALNKDRVIALIQSLEQEPSLLNKAIVTLLLYTGVRLDELLSLKRKDIAKCTHLIALRVVSPKGVVRMIPLHTNASRILNDYLNGRDDSNEYLFVKNGKKALGLRQLQGILAMYQVNSQQLRQTFVSELIRLNYTMLEISGLMYGNEAIVKNLDSLYNDIYNSMHAVKK